MKIDPTERSPQLPRQAVDNTKRNHGPCGFDTVLQQTMQKPGPPEECMGSAIRSMAGPQTTMGVPPGPESAVETLARNLLDRLEDYQQMLGDPAASLKKIQPAVDRMERQAVGTRALIADMPADHPLRTIIQDTLASINQEVERFNAGYYVDD